MSSITAQETWMKTVIYVYTFVERELMLQHSEAMVPQVVMNDDMCNVRTLLISNMSFNSIAIFKQRIFFRKYILWGSFT